MDFDADQAPPPDEGGPPNILASFFQNYGWRLVFFGLFWYFMGGTVREYLNRSRERRILAEANRPDRKRVLDEERRRVRAEQQRLAMDRAASAQEEGKRGGTAPSASSSQAPKPKPSSSLSSARPARPLRPDGGYNPMGGGGGLGGGWKPSSNTQARRNPPRGGG
jgi:hypothetical protein